MIAILLLAAAGGQDPAAMEAALARQRASVEKQRISVRVQVRGAEQSAAGAFFTAPWTQPLTPRPALVASAECEPVPEDQIGPLIEEIAAREGLTPDLLRAVIEKESAFVPCAVSPKGAQGLMQLMPATAADLGVHDPLDARENLAAGARFLRRLLDRYGGNLVLGLAAYNAGPRRVDEAGGVPAIPETLDYVSKILGRLDK